MGMGFAPTWLRQVSPTASRDHFNHCARPSPHLLLYVCLTYLNYQKISPFSSKLQFAKVAAFFETGYALCA